MDKDKQQQAQQKYMELRMLEAQMQQAEKQLAQLEQQADELGQLQVQLDEFKMMKEGSAMLAPIANGIFTQATLNSSKELLVNVGAGTVVKKPVDKVKELLAKQAGDVRGMQQEITSHVQRIAAEAEKAHKVLQALVQ